MSVLRKRGLLAAGLAGLALVALSNGRLVAQTGSDLADAGDAVFQRWCATCHGDRGQGLTPEWRATWPADHQNCSQRFCHGPDHPPWAAHIVNNTVPALIGPDTLGRFDTPQELYRYTRAEMPRGWEGHLSTDEYRALTVFLLYPHRLEAPGGVAPGAGQMSPAGWPGWKWRRLQGLE
jgi:mono/diheme cytochrome c family protein